MNRSDDRHFNGKAACQNTVVYIYIEYIYIHVFFLCFWGILSDFVSNEVMILYRLVDIYFFDQVIYKPSPLLLNEWHWIAYRNAISYFGILQRCISWCCRKSKKDFDDFGEEFHHAGNFFCEDHCGCKPTEELSLFVGSLCSF